MAKRSRKRKDDREIFRRLSKATRNKVKKRYLELRQQDPDKPIRCDNPACNFHTQRLDWLGQPLGLILDHKNGVNHDNRDTNLRLLCPNCDSQLSTKGGGNKGRIKMLSDSLYVIGRKNEPKTYVFVAGPIVIDLKKTGN